MDLQNVNVIDTQTLKAPIHRLKDVLPIQANLINLLAIIHTLHYRLHLRTNIIDIEEDLGHDHDFGAGNVVFLEEGTDDAFGLPVGVGVCYVEGVDAAVIGIFHDGEGLFEGDDPWLPGRVAIGHAS